MKRIIILILITLLGCNTINADAVKFDNRNQTETMELSFNENMETKDYNFVVDKKQLGEYLELDETDTIQVNNVYNTYDAFCEGMLMAGRMDDEERRVNLIFNSIDYVLKGMDYYLTKWQYRKFLIELNMIFYNKGFLGEVYLYCDKSCK